MRDALAFVCEIDFHENRFRAVSEAMCQISGYSQEELSAMSPTALLDEEGQKVFQERLACWTTGGETEGNAEYGVRLKDGSTIHIVLSDSLSRDEHGNPSGTVVIGLDLSEHRLAGQTVQQEYELVKTIIQNSPTGFSLMRGSDLLRVVVNPAYQLFASSVEDGQHEDLERQAFDRLCRQVLASGEPYHAIDELRQVRRIPGSPREPAYFSWSLSRVDLPGEKCWGILNTARETTERKRAEEALIQSQSYLSQLIQTSYEGIWSVDSQGKTTFANQRAAEILDYTIQEIQGKDAFDFLMPGEIQAGYDTLARIAAGESGRVEAHARRKDGSEAILLVSFSPITGENGQFQGALAMFTDITERKQSEQSVQETTEKLKHYSEQLEASVRERTEELINLQRRLFDTLESERLWVSRDLHDGPMQDIYALMYKISLFKSLSDDPVMQKEIDSVIEQLKAINENLRTVARELRPASLTPFGLEKAIREHSQRFAVEYPGLKFSLDLQEDGTQVPESIRLALFRIYQTALINVVRHAEAKNIFVVFSFDEETVFLEIRDDGKGFEVPERLRTLVREGHFGLAGAAERAEAVGGKLEVESVPGEWTRLRVIAPLGGSGT